MAVCSAVIGIHILGLNIKLVSTEKIEAINDAYPRLAIKQHFKDSLIGLIQRKPQTTYDNFVKDIGERYVPGFKAPSGADVLQNAPYPE